jgi:hypothetical protein
LYVTILHRCCIMLSELHKVKKWCGEPIWRTGRLRDNIYSHLTLGAV